MCGIFGIFGLDATTINKEIIYDTIASRGPDARGEYIENESDLEDQVMLLHTRLKIIDLNDSANQPFYEGDKVLLFNGEIYNYKELREELIGLGYTFRTLSDTEVVIKLLIEYIKRDSLVICMNKMRGMFAICLYDKVTKQIILARDRLGIKPLYYYMDDKYIIFGSNIRSILKTKKIESKLSIKGISSYLSFRSAIGSNTSYERIKKLEPGNMMLINNRIPVIKKYWELPNQNFNNEISYEELKNDVYNILEESIRIRMVCDVNYGAYLSGGVDSSTVVAIMNKYTPIVNTYSVGFQESNEFKYAQIVAEKFNTRHTELLINSEEFFKALIELIDIKGEPLGVPNEVPLYLLSKLLKNKVTVMLSGEGADELFHGYGRIFRLEDDLDISKPLYLNFLKKYSYVPFEQKKEIFVEELWQELEEDKEIHEFYREAFDNVEDIIELQDKISYIFLKHHLPILLHRLDSSTMAAAVEGRVPFVDHKLIEYVLSKVPKEWKIRWKSDKDAELAEGRTAAEISEVHDIPKYILKDCMKGMLSDEILYRKKIGFPVPLRQWFDCEASRIIKRIIETGYVREYFKMDAIIKKLDTFMIWFILNLEITVRLHIKGESVERVLEYLIL